MKAGILRYGVLASVIVAAGLAGSLVTAATSDIKSPIGPDKVVYHISDTEQQTKLALQYIRNHLEVNPKAKIVVVTHALGVDFLREGLRDKNGNPYNVPVEDLDFRGVRFLVCGITLRERKMKESQFIPEAKFVPSGVAEIARLQQREGYAYIKP
ncbi:MAG: DsrE family protein [Betaproteobacteria bacterium]|nr:MAG: DsrE family protein [Betaproteobacteria bacterium]